MQRVIITAAITGSVHTPSMSPYLPITPQQIANEAVRAYEAGAAVAHIHVRNPETGQPIPDIELFKEVLINVKNKCNIILCLTTGGGMGMTIEERVKVVSVHKPELASFNFGSMNFGLFEVPQRMKIEKFNFPWEEKYLKATEDLVFSNTFKTLREFCQIFNENETKPEIEIYDVGMIYNVAYFLEKGYLKKPVYLQFVMGILGGITASPNNLMLLHNVAREAIGDFVWSACAAGRNQIPLCTVALTLGGNARVGLEDNIHSSKGILAKSNADQVEKIVRITRELGLEPATPDEARQILGLKGLNKVNW